MPPWTTMQELVTGDLVTESDMAALRENITYLLDPNRAEALVSGGNYTTTSLAFVDVDSTNLSLTLETHGGPVLVLFSGNVYASSTAYRVRFDVAVDGTRYSGAALGLLQQGDLGGAADSARPVSFAVLVGNLAPGTHTFTLQWAVASGCTVSLVAHPVYSPVMFTAVEV
ncbi:MAG: hypothetical protein Kow0077_13810 [Anaerolineae bacterium]